MLVVLLVILTMVFFSFSKDGNSVDDTKDVSGVELSDISFPIEEDNNIETVDDKEEEFKEDKNVVLYKENNDLNQDFINKDVYKTSNGFENVEFDLNSYYSLEGNNNKVSGVNNENNLNQILEKKDDSDSVKKDIENNDIELVNINNKIDISNITPEENNTFLSFIYELLGNNNSGNNVLNDEMILQIRGSQLFNNSPLIQAHVEFYEENKIINSSENTDSNVSSGEDKNDVVSEENNIEEDNSDRGLLANTLSGVAASTGSSLLSGTGTSTASATVGASLYFGGRVTAVLPCLCSGTTLVTIFDYVTNTNLPLVYQPGFTKLYSGYNLFTPGVNVLGSYTPGTGVCLIPGTPCPIIPSVGAINSLPGVGTGFTPGL